MNKSDQLLTALDNWTAAFAEFVWGTPLLVLLLGGGLFFTLYARFIPFRYLGHAVQIIRGKFDDPDEPGQINHFQALSSALASTVGMGNISGVAVAIHMGGPGALFWMWVSAIVGMATKFFTCTLAIMYRGNDDQGEIQGGPMYVITEALPRYLHWLAFLFAIAGLFGCLTLFQANQLTQILVEETLNTSGWSATSLLLLKLTIGVIIALLVALVIFGGIRRIGYVAARMVPAMVSLYIIAGLVVLMTNLAIVPEMLLLILRDAFTGEAVLGGAVGAVIITGIRRAAFSNEAGIGTEAMAHGAAKTSEPIREGMVAMIGPLIDTIFVCTITALVILSTGVWQGNEANGVTLTTQAFAQALPGVGKPLLIISVLIFSISTMIGYSYYGAKCTSFLFGTHHKKTYRIFYTAMLIVGAVVSIDAVINFLDGMFALMAIPTVISTLLLSPRVMAASKKYFQDFNTHSQQGGRDEQRYVVSE